MREIWAASIASIVSALHSCFPAQSALSTKQQKVEVDLVYLKQRKFTFPYTAPQHDYEKQKEIRAHGLRRSWRIHVRESSKAGETVLAECRD